MITLPLGITQQAAGGGSSPGGAWDDIQVAYELNGDKIMYSSLKIGRNSVFIDSVKSVTDSLIIYSGSNIYGIKER